MYVLTTPIGGKAPPHSAGVKARTERMCVSVCVCERERERERRERERERERELR